jgi:hypothetical protein
MSGRLKTGWPLHLLILLGFLGGCSTIDDLSRETYRRGTLVDQAMASERVAILPMWAQGETRDYLPEAEGIFTAALSEMRPNLQIIHPKEARQILGGIDSAYRSAQEAFTAQHVAREEDLRRIGRELNVRFVLGRVRVSRGGISF